MTPISPTTIEDEKRDTPPPPSLCSACEHAQSALPEPARTSLLVVVSFAAGVLLYSYMSEREAAGKVCFPTETAASTTKE